MLYLDQHKAHALPISRCVGLALVLNYVPILAYLIQGARMAPL